jgi:predicted nucleic acid-binding protein
VPSATLHLCRDPKDNHLLEAALEGRADFLVSRDDDLKGDDELIAQMKRHGVKIMTISGFLKMLAENDLS